jgi:tol-pal system protein YbgF
MQESIDRSNGQLVALISQIGDNVALARQSISVIQGAMNETQARVSGSLGAFDSRLLTLDANVRTVNQRLAQALDQIAAVNQNLAAWQHQAVTVDPTDPVQVFSAAYTDYLKGNYQLAVDQFRLFLNKFPQSEQADDAQYMIGEAFYSQGIYEQAIAEFDKVLELFPNGSKTPAARLKKGLAYLKLNQTEQGAAELRTVIKDYPDALEAVSARQRLEELGLPVEEPKQPPRRPRRKSD